MATATVGCSHSGLGSIFWSCLYLICWALSVPESANKNLVKHVVYVVP